VVGEGEYSGRSGFMRAELAGAGRGVNAEPGRRTAGAAMSRTRYLVGAADGGTVRTVVVAVVEGRYPG
jgi:hypothetical protein